MFFPFVNAARNKARCSTKRRHSLLDVFEFLGHECFADCWAGNSPSDAKHIERLLGGQIAPIRCGTGVRWGEIYAGRYLT